MNSQLCLSTLSPGTEDKILQVASLENKQINKSQRFFERQLL